GPAGVTTATGADTAATGVVADAVTAGRTATAAVVVGACMLARATPDLVEPMAEPPPSTTACTAARTSAMAWRASGLGAPTIGDPTMGFASDGAGLVGTTGGVDDMGVPSSSAGSLCAVAVEADDGVLDSAATGGLVGPPRGLASVSASWTVLPGDRPCGVPVDVRSCLVPVDADGRCVDAFGVSADSGAEDADEVPRDAPGLLLKFALLLAGEPLAPSAAVPSAWATPVPLASAAPRPRVSAPAPSQPLAARVVCLARCRPCTLRDPPEAVFARCPPATSAPRRTRCRS
ncbi:MAG: hypothetical protein QOJ95_2674, partial [Mycobacterium sp.]|nr:hypothetical protein [Mycobacterium sp.]